MKALCILAVCAATLTGVRAYAVPNGVTTHVKDVEHGGGCRRDSPPGQCCHAGRQPYHCH